MSANHNIYGFVYVLANQSMPGIYKIGHTTRAPMQRAAELSGTTGVPTPFVVAYYAEVFDPAKVERCAHEKFATNRLCQSREFFRMEPSELQRVFDLLDGECSHRVLSEIGLMIVNPAGFGPYIQLFPAVIRSEFPVSEASA